MSLLEDVPTEQNEPLWIGQFVTGSWRVGHLRQNPTKSLRLEDTNYRVPICKSGKIRTSVLQLAVLENAKYVGLTPLTDNKSLTAYVLRGIEFTLDGL